MAVLLELERRADFHLLRLVQTSERPAHGASEERRDHQSRSSRQDTAEVRTASPLFVGQRLH